MQPTKEPVACGRLQRKNYGPRLVEHLASGSSSSLESYGDIVAKKVNFLSESDADASLPSYLVAETSHLLTLKLPSVVSIKDVKLEKDQALIFMEKLGSSLQDLSYDEKQAKPIIYQLLLTVAELHSRGVIHGDLKPENILLKKDQPVLIDFGFSIQSVVLKNGTVRPIPRIEGDPEWSAPEFAEKQESTSAIDIWPLALIWIWLLSPIDLKAQVDPEFEQVLRDQGTPEDLIPQILEEEAKHAKNKHRLQIINLLQKEETYRDGLNQVRQMVSKPVFTLLSQMLVYEPKYRPSARKLMDDGYFRDLWSTPSLLTPRESLIVREYRVRLNLKEVEISWRSDQLIWLFQNCQRLGFSYRIYFLAVKLLDLVWSLDPKLITDDTANICLSLAQKFLYGRSSVGYDVPRALSQMFEREDDFYNDEEQLVELERQVYTILCYNVNYSTAYDYFLQEQGTQRTILLTLLRTPLAYKISDWQLAKAALEPIKSGTALDDLLKTEWLEEVDWKLVDE